MEYATKSGATILFESLWRTRYENDVPINEMEDEHLVNTIDYLTSRMRASDAPREDYRLPIVDLPRSEHNIEVLKRELVRRAEAND